MAGNIPMGSMSTEVKLDGSQSVKTLRELKQAVTQATSAWKAQRAELSTIGKSTEAAEAKYKGLAETIKKQKDYISGLQEAQKHLTEAQKSVDRSTKEGRQEYGKYNEALQKNETRIHSAEQKLVSLTNQQTKAKSSLNYYKSGLADVQKQLKVNESVAKSYVVRLKAEGKGYESAKAKLNSYKDSLANLRKQQSIQTSELSRIARETGKSSDAYKRQEVRVNQTATSIAKLNSKIKSSQTEVNKLNPKGFNKLANGAKHVTNAADKMKAGLKSAWANVKSGATAAAAGIGAVGAAALSGAKKAGNLQQTYKEITNLAVTGGEKQKEVLKAVTQMQRDGRDMSIKYGKSQQSIAEAYEDLIKRGYTTKQALGAMNTELQASVASGDDFKDVVSVSSTTLESFNMRADSTAKMTKNTKRAVNELAYAADMTSTGFKDLGYGMSYVGASAHSAGFGLSETAAAMGVLSNHGLEASKAGTGLNEVINRLSVATGNLIKGDKKNALAKLGIKPKEITDSTGKLKNLSAVFGVLNKHMKGMSKVQKINIMKSLFGMTGEQAGLILANNSKYLGQLSKEVLKAGKNGDYVAQLSKKNSQTAQMQMARAKRAMEAFTMTLGSAMLPAINKAGNSLAKFLNSKDGEKFQKNVGGAVSKVANGIVGFIEFITKHPTETKAIATGLGAAYGVVKLASFVQWLNKTRLAFKGLSIGSKLLSGWDKSLIHLSNTKTRIGKVASAIGKLNGKFLSVGKKLGTALGNGLKSIGGKALSAGKFLGSKITQGIKATMKFSMSKRLATGALAGAAVATPEVINAVKDRHNANKRSQDIGGAVGALAGGTLTSMIPVVGPMLAPVGAIIGKYAGRWGGQAVNNFTKGWQKNKPPKKFWSLENLGWSTHDMFNKIGKWGGQVGKKFGQNLSKGKSWVKKNSKELALTAVNPIAGIPTLLYKNNPKFRKWANGVAKNIKSGLNKAKKSITRFKNSVNKDFKKAWDSAYKHSSKGTRQIMRSVSKFAKNYVKTNSKANRATLKNFSSFGARLKKNHGNLFKTLGQTAKKQLAIEKKRWSSNWKNIRSTAQEIWKGLNHNASDMYKKLNTATHGGLGKVLSSFKSFGKGIKDFWNGLWKGITKTFDDTVKNLQDAANNVGKFFTGKLKVGSLHLANGTDWRKKYGTPAVVNDAPGENYREGLLVNGQVIPFPDKRNIPFWLLPGQDIVNGNDMTKMFGHAVHYADGTVHLSKDHKYSKKNYELAKKRAVEDKKELDKLGDKISNALKHKDGNEARRLTKEFNKLTKKYSAAKKAAKKPDPHAGKVLVDQGLLIGAKSRIGHSVYISKDLFKKLIANLNKKKSTTRRRTTTHKRRSTTAKRTSTRRYSSRVTTPRISSGVSARISTVGLGSINGLSKALKGIKSKSIKVVAKASGTKAVTSLAKSVGKVKGSSHKVIIKTSGLTSLRKLAKAANKIKGKTHKVRVRASGTKGLKSLQKNITSVHKRIDSLSKASKKDKFGKAIAKQAEEAVKSLKGKGNFAKQFESMTKKFNKDLKNMTKNSKKEFKSMWSDIEHQSKTGQSRLTHEMSSFSSHYKKSWSSLENGVHRTFGQFWSKMKSAAGRGVNGVLRVVNSAIGKIDSVISDFGGSKRAVKSVTPVRYAEGTDANGRLTQNTLAIVNDAKSGPRQEAIVTDQNDVILPKGNDVPVMLRKGWGVLNGTQTQQLGLPHFANGTGLSLKKLYDIAKHNWNNPTKTGNSMFSAVSGLTGAMKELASGMRSKSKDQGVTWWSQLWKMVEDKVNDGDLGPASGLLKAVEELGRNKHYSQSKRMSKFFADCSSLVSRALAKYYHVGWSTPNGWALTVAGLWQHAHRISRSEAKPGDPVFWLPDEHVGVYAGHGKYYSAYGPNDGGPVGMQSVAPGAVFGRFDGLNTEGDKSKSPKVKANSALQKKIRGQVGKGFWQTIQKIADKYGDNGLAGAFKLGGDVAQRVKALAKALKQADPRATRNGLAAIIGNAITESTLNPSIVNGIGAAGLWQFYDTRRAALNSYAARHHVSWKNPATQINFALNGDSSRALFRSILEGNRSVASLAYEFSKRWEVGGHDAEHVQGALSAAKILHGYANGGLANTASIFGEAGPEMAIPLIPSKSTRAWELIGKAVAILSGQSGFNLNQQQVVDTKEKKEEHDFRESVLFLLQQLVGKSDVAKITLQTPQGRTLWQVVEPFAKEENKKEIMRLKRGLSGRR
jgi:TP901 family phage tail tape measure protein